MPEIKGGCLCGAVRYSASGDPAFVGICHCTDCQKFTGASFATVIGVPKPALSVQGEMASYGKTGDSGKTITRRFCPKCGSSLMDEADALPNIVMLGAGTLDDAGWVKPGMQIYCDSAQPWVSLAGEMQRFGKMPG
jgi:hypothetical protein